MEPLPLNQLPEYLKNKDTLNPDNSVLVDMGQITPSKRSYSKIYAILGVLLLLFVSAPVLYLVKSNSNTIIITTNQEKDDLNKILNDSGAKVINIEKNENDAFLAKVKTNNFKDFLKNLRKNEKIISVEENF